MVNVFLQTVTEDEQYMLRCIQLGSLGSGRVAPNPMVGALLVYEGMIIKEGFHHTLGSPHAEVNALEFIDDKQAENSTLYVNLEPCNHFGRTPPCTDLIIRKKIKKVVVGTVDPNPIVSGKGIARLKAHGIDIVQGVCEKECRELNERFFTAIEKKRPYIILKYAQTVDGFIGFNNTELENSNRSKQISNLFSQRLTHKWRMEEDGLLVGTKTALQDNPRLNARLYGNNHPVRIVFDRNLKIPDTSYLFNRLQKTIILTEKEMPFSHENLQYIQIEFNDQLLKNALKKLLQMNIHSILVEGGTSTLQHFIDSGYWDECRVFTASVSWGHGLKGPVHGPYSSFSSEEKSGTDTLTVYKNTNAGCL